MTEDTPVCQLHKKLEGIKCANPALPDDPEGLCILHSKQKQKDDEGAFSTAVREKLDLKDYNFRWVFFPTKADFKRHEFEEEADFIWATFSEEANFEYSIFHSGASFIGTAFLQKANFTGVTIAENKTVHFRVTDFSEKDEIIFRGAKVFGKLIFEQINTGRNKKNRRFHGDFIRINLGPTGIIKFRDVSLAYVKFEGTNLNEIEFDDVEWYPLLWRLSIYEEILLRKNHSPRGYARVEKLYRQLKTNYNSQHDYKRVGDFHYGEMEMHRKESQWRRWLSWYSIYYALSGYGERPLRAISWLAVFLAVFTGLLAWAGLEILDPKYSASFGNPFFYLLQKVTLQRPTWAEPLGFGGKLVAGLSVLLIPGQAALFLLALRNRLGRRR